jgi:adenylate cyclase
MARLVLETKEGQQIVELQGRNSLGRHPNNTIQLLDKIVSKEHCIVELRATGFVLRDLGSLNGTYVNGTRVIGERDLKHGDEITLGQSKARFEDAAAAPGYPVAPTGHPPATQPAQWPQQGQAAQQPQQWQQQPPARHQFWPAQGTQGSGPVSSTGTPQNAVAPQAAQPGANQAYARQQAPQSQAFNYQQPPATYGRPDLAAFGAPTAAVPAVGQQPPQRRLPPPPQRTNTRAFATAFLPAMPATTTRVDQDDEARQIGAEIAANEADFRPFDEVAQNPVQLRDDYEKLRLTHELTRTIANETDPEKMLEKILQSVFAVTQAQRGVIFTLDANGEPQPVASHRQDGGKGAISVSSTIMRKVLDEKKAVITQDAGVDFAASKGKSMILNQIHSAIVAPMIHNDQFFGVLWLDSKSLAHFQQKDLELVMAVANQAAMFMEINFLEKKKGELSRFVSPAVADEVLSRQVDLGGNRTECTVYNSDIRGFTRMSEHTEPEHLVEMLNSYFEAMVEVVFKYDGTLDKFMGDGIMALWGAPVSHEDDPERAVECALEQTEVLGRFNRSRMERDRPPLGVGIAVHTGPVVAGYIGTKRTLSYTVIGDVANTSARLCAQALAGQIVVSEDTKKKLSPRFEVEELAPMRIRGKDKPMRVYNVVRTRPLVAVASEVPSTAKLAQLAGQPAVTRLSG